MLVETCLQIKNRKIYNVEKLNYAKTVSECNKLSGLITNIFGRNITILSKQEYDYVRIKYGEIINGSLLTKGDNSIDHVGNA